MMDREINRVATLAEMVHAVDMENRVSTLEAIIPTLVTKDEFNKAMGELRVDMERIRTEMEKGQKENRNWMVATVIGLFVAILAAGGFFGNQVNRAVERATERSFSAQTAAERAAKEAERTADAAERTAVSNR